MKTVIVNNSYNIKKTKNHVSASNHQSPHMTLVIKTWDRHLNETGLKRIIEYRLSPPFNPGPSTAIYSLYMNLSYILN